MEARIRSYSLASLLSITLFWGAQVQAQAYLQPHRLDQTLPQHCLDMQPRYFDGPFADMTVGIAGATQKGFTHEIPIQRDQANVLWHVFKARARGAQDFYAERFMYSDPSLEPFYGMIESNYRQMGFTFGSEGDVLELLALVYLRSMFPVERYYHTGGYGYFYGGREVGELDIIVGERQNCDVVVVGQAKLGLGSGSSAWEQIRRFKNYIKDVLHRTLGIQFRTF